LSTYLFALIEDTLKTNVYTVKAEAPLYERVYLQTSHRNKQVLNNS